MPGSSVRPGKEPKTSPARVASLPPAPPVGQPARCFQQQGSASQSPAVGNLVPPHPILTSGSCRPHFSARPGRQPKPFPQTSPIPYGCLLCPTPSQRSACCGEGTPSCSVQPLLLWPQSCPSCLGLRSQVSTQSPSWDPLSSFLKELI